MSTTDQIHNSAFYIQQHDASPRLERGRWWSDVIDIEPPWVVEGKQHLQHLARLHQDYDNEGSGPPTTASVKIASRVIDQLPEWVRFWPPTLAASTDGGILLEWYGTGMMLAIEIAPEGHLHLLQTGRDDDTFDEDVFEQAYREVMATRGT